MTVDQNTTHSNQIEHNDKIADAEKANINKTAAQGKQIADAAREGINKMVDLREQTTEAAKQIVQKGIETACHQARGGADRFPRALGFSGEQSDGLARQSKQ